MASSEAHPLIKTGGLADVAASLPAALVELGHDARLIIPAYPKAVKQVREPKSLCEVRIPGTHEQVRILGGRLPDSRLQVYLIDAPDHFCREGSPYTDLTGRDWGDNAERFMLFNRILARVAMGMPALGWSPQILHCNDWQTGLAPALMQHTPERPATIFTIHNLAYQGLFDRATFDRLGLSPALWAVNGLEFHQRMSFIKGGLVFSDLVNTVSPTYAEEVCTPRYGCGLDGLLRQLGGRFQGILNGIDYGVWNPQTDTLIHQNYTAEHVNLKVENKLSLQREMGLPRERTYPVVRLHRQAGGAEGGGHDPRHPAAPARSARCPGGAADHGRPAHGADTGGPGCGPSGQVAVHAGYDEARAHRIEAGCDAFLMPSRFEPCGLNQMYSLRYGTVPIVRRTGGLADTVVHASPERFADGTATGFLFDEPTAEALWGAVEQALGLYREHPDQWRAMAVAGMGLDFSWQRSAREYEHLYEQALAERREAVPAA